MDSCLLPSFQHNSLPVWKEEHGAALEMAGWATAASQHASCSATTKRLSWDGGWTVLPNPGDLLSWKGNLEL